jgi:hypothetical protein
LKIKTTGRSTTKVWIAVVILLALKSSAIYAYGRVTTICPSQAIATRGRDYAPGGIILVPFDNRNLWVYNIITNRRYPLPETQPCGANCRLSPDARWVTYIDPQTGTYMKMRLDGTERTPLAEYASDIQWWSPETLLIWTPGKEAYLRPEQGDAREYLDVKGVVSVQPGGRWALTVRQDGDLFRRALVNLETRNLPAIGGDYIDLGPDAPYFDATAWSADGQWLAYVSRITTGDQAGSGELFGIRPGTDDEPVQLTGLLARYGPVRINGRSSADLSWSPDGGHLAFWVIPLAGTDPEQDAGEASIHVLDIETTEMKVYCGFTTRDHTPNAPRLIWSPEGTHLAFGADVKGDEKSYLLLALDLETGVFTELSHGIYPTFGGANPVAWGLAP